MEHFIISIIDIITTQNFTLYNSVPIIIDLLILYILFRSFILIYISNNLLTTD
jgi:hypothetical protein